MIDDLLDRDAPGERERITRGFRDLIGRMQAEIDAKRQAERVRHQELFKKMGDDQLARDHRPVCTRLGLPACRKPTCGLSYCSGTTPAREYSDGLPDAFPWPDDGF